MASNPPPRTGGTSIGPPGSGNDIGGLNMDSPLGALIHIVEALIGDLNQAITETQNIPLGAMYHGISRQVTKFVDLVTGDHTRIWDQMTAVSVGRFYSEMLELGLGVDISKMDQLAKDGIQTTDTILGFAYIMPWIVAAASLAGKIPLAGRWIEMALEPVAKLPEEMGLSWALGTQIEGAVEAATGESVLEGIREQKRSSRIGWPIIRTLLRQRAIDHGTFLDLMRRQGFPEEQIDMIRKLDSTIMPIGELQQLWLMGEIDRSTFREQLRGLGYPEENVNWLTTLMIDKAATSSGTLLRSTARGLAQQQLISLDDYRGILTQVNTPEREIKDDVQAIQLEISHGHLQTSLSALKNLYLRGTLHPQELTTQLAQLGYTPVAIADLVASWEAGPTPRPLSMAKILSFYVSGVLTETDTRARLLAAGIKPKDADLLISHAMDVPRVRPHPLTPALVTQAYLDGAIDHGALEAAYERAGATGEVAQDYIASAVFRRSRQRRPAGETIQLTAAQLVDAWSFGLIDVHTVLADLEHLGYASEDAMIVLGIKAKGPVSLAAPPAPDFATPADAIAYLEAEGYTITGPPDPKIAEAEAILWGLGYTITPPADQSSRGGGGGGGFTR